MINSISLNGSVLTSEEAAADEAQVAANPVAEEPAVRLVKPLWKSRQKLFKPLRNRLMNNNKVEIHRRK